jgi:EAL domain-containing protein (putative c-di-GMP-specific phosphodiesterase class I)
VLGFGLSPESIVLEVSEAQLAQPDPMAQESLARLALRRFQIGVDGIHQGNLSLAQLAKFPFHEFKFDASLAKRLTIDPLLKLTAKAYCGLARDLKVQAVGQGIVNQDDWNAFRELGCTAMQGPLIGPAMPAQEVNDWLENWQSRVAKARQNQAPHSHPSPEAELSTL